MRFFQRPARQNLSFGFPFSGGTCFVGAPMHAGVLRTLRTATAGGESNGGLSFSQTLEHPLFGA